MAKVLVVTNTPHIPANSGYSQRVSAVINALESAGHMVWAISIKPLVETPNQNVKKTTAKGSLAVPLKVLIRLAATPSLSLLKWYSPKACHALAAISAGCRPDVVVLESSYLSPYQVIFSCPIVFDLHNIESQLIANFAKDRGGLIGKAAHIEARLLERLEARIPQRVFGVATVSDSDQELLIKLSTNYNIADISDIVAAPNGVAEDAFSVPDQIAEATAPIAVFIGHLGWRPNIDGAKWLAGEVWPRVIGQLPNARLQIIGRDPAPAVQALASPDINVTVHGNVDSVFPFLAEAAVATAPLWTAGGTRLKILEALGTSTPVVATRLGALGLESLAADDVLEIVDAPAEFAAALVSHLAAPHKSPAAKEAAEAYRWSNTLAKLVDLVNHAAS